MTETFGRNRNSIAGLREQLSSIFLDHPECSTRQNEDGTEDPVVPAAAITQILRSFSTQHGMTLLNPGEAESLEQTTSSMDNVLITTDDLLGFIAMATASAPPSAPQGDLPSDSATVPEQSSTPPDEAADRGRGIDRTQPDQGHSSRTSSNDSVVTSIYRPESRSSNPLRRVPSTPAPPKSADQLSRFDSETRQRSIPLQNAPPSAFGRRPLPLSRRRKSDGGTSHSDSESPSVATFANGRRRGRAPSNPASPSSLSSSQSFTFPSPPGAGSTFSPDSSFGDEHSFSGTRVGGRHSPPKGAGHEHHAGDDSVEVVDDMLGDMTRDSYDSGNGSDPDENRPFENMMMRSATSSLVSLDSPEERIEVLQRANQDLNKKLQEKEGHFMARFAELEQSIEELQGRLEQMRTELVTAKREEKELRQKEGRTTIQLNSFEAEISKLQRNLETSRASYTNLQKQYSEQCAEAERYRNSLRNKDSTIKDCEDQISQQSSELTKIKIDKDVLESTILSLESELETVRQTQQELEDQKQENMLLKETIDRLRFDLDELRTTSAAAALTRPTGNSRNGSMTRSLANELKARLDAQEEEEESDEDEDVGNVDLNTLGSSMGQTIEDDDGTEYIETIITAQRRRKVGSRTNKNTIVRVEELREFADAYTQHDSADFVASANIQTDPLPPPPPPPATRAMEVQTDSEPATLTASMEVQTDEPEVEHEAGPSSLASSTESVQDIHLSSSLASTSSSATLHFDSPPSYENIANDEKSKLFAKWHPGFAPTTDGTHGIAGGVSRAALADWANLKKEIGFECLAIEKALSASQVKEDSGDGNDSVELEWVPNSSASTSATISASDGEISEADKPSTEGKKSRRRFYNIYNTYFLPSGSGEGGNRSPFVSLKDLAWLGAGLSLALIATSVMEPKEHYEDRSYWAAYNTVGTPWGPHGTGDEPSYEALWVVFQKIAKGSLAFARRAPGLINT